MTPPGGKFLRGWALTEENCSTPKYASPWLSLLYNCTVHTVINQSEYATRGDLVVVQNPWDYLFTLIETSRHPLKLHVRRDEESLLAKNKMVDKSTEWDCHIRLKSILVGENDAKRDVLKILFGENSQVSFSVNLQNVMFDASGFRCCMQFWNVPAPQYAPSLRTSSGPYCCNVSAVLFAFDVTNKHSFNRLDEWVRVVDSHNVNAVSPSMVEVGKVIIGIRGGDDSKREVSKAQVLKFSQKYNIPFVELDGRAPESESQELLAKELRRMLASILNSLPHQVDALCLMGTGMDLGDLALGTILKGGALSGIQLPEDTQVHNLKIVKPTFLVQKTGIVSPIATPQRFGAPSNFNEKSASPRLDRDRQENTPAMYTSGARVHAEWQAGGQWFPAKITTVQSNGTYDLLYDDGTVEREVAKQHIKLMDGTSNVAMHMVAISTFYSCQVCH